MNKTSISLTLDKRTTLGKQVRALRRSGKIPAVIHNHGKESIVVEAPIVAITKVYESAGRHHAVDLTVGSDKYLAIIKDVDLDPYKNTLRHVVFDALHQNEKVKTEVPIRLEGDSAAEKAGLMLLPQLEALEIEATPRNLPDVIVVNIEALEDIGDRILVSDITPPKDVTVVTDAEHPIVSVIETPAQQSEEAEVPADDDTAPDGASPESPEEGKNTDNN